MKDTERLQVHDVTGVLVGFEKMEEMETMNLRIWKTEVKQEPDATERRESARLIKLVTMATAIQELVEREELGLGGLEDEEEMAVVKAVVVLEGMEVLEKVEREHKNAKGM